MAGDFVEVGSRNHLGEAILGWVEKGYETLASKHFTTSSVPSWRFWAKGSGSDALMCGLCKDSSDSLGRPFPLLVFGTGRLSGWKNAWELLPLACERPWREMEYLCAKRFDAFEQFKTGVRQLKAPSRDWSALKEELLAVETQTVSLPTDDALSCCEGSLEHGGWTVADAQVLFCALEQWSFEDVSVVSARLHHLLKRENPEAPSAVFIGGSGVKTFLVVFRRALAPLDFVRLWLGRIELDGPDEGPAGSVGGHRFGV